MINIQILKTKYPLAYNEFLLWAKEQLMSNLGVSKEMEEAFSHEKSLEVFLPSIIKGRSLYDWLDSYRLYLVVNVNKENSWYSDIREGNSSPLFKNRKDAESWGFEEGFRLLNKMLS